MWSKLPKKRCGGKYTASFVQIKKLLVVTNKMDLNPSLTMNILSMTKYPKKTSLPALQNLMNIPYLKEKLYELAIGDQKYKTSALPSMPVTRQALEAAAINLREVLSGLDTHLKPICLRSIR
ncbi:MAG: hypothetical protein IPN15_06840 [Saprospiraceae bacterium]|nr:hypothetical protein [Candidatus Vicinibacter affinis]